MKITALSLAVVCLFAISVRAHADDTDFNDGLKQELSQDVEQMYPKRPKKVAQDTTQTQVQVQAVKTQTVQPAQAPAATTTSATTVTATTAPVAAPATAPTTQLQPIYILQQPQAAPAAQVQPTTTVEAAPVKDSKIDQLRKQREDVEHQTEDKLMQRLEDDRLLSEKERADRLAAPLNPTPTPAPAPAPAVQSFQQTPTTAVVVPATMQTVTSDTPVSSATATAKVETSVPATTSDDEAKTILQIGGLAGVGAYPTVNNVNGSYAVGAQARILTPDRLGIEGTFTYSQYDIKNVNPCQFPYCQQGASLVKSLDQLNFTGGVTYNILSGRISPVVGGLVGYTRRTYSDRLTYGYYPAAGTTGTNAFDGGLLVGVDIQAAKHLTVGADFRYMMNLSYRADDAMAYYGYYFGNPLEQLNYYFATVNLKLDL